MSRGCLGPQPFPEPMAPVSGLVGPAGPFALSSCLCATTLVFTGGPRTFCPAVSFSVALQGLASSECHSQGEQSNRLDGGGSQPYLESPDILCNCTLSRVPSLPDPPSLPGGLLFSSWRAGSLLGNSWLYHYTPTFKMPLFLKAQGSGDPCAEQTEGHGIWCPTLSTIPPLKG